MFLNGHPSIPHPSSFQGVGRNTEKPSLPDKSTIHADELSTCMMMTLDHIFLLFLVEVYKEYQKEKKKNDQFFFLSEKGE